uniref:Uncharacterized protein n=1 Tax=Polynucleobacter necessarius subsp. necessarius (strain STIR1) TaxID=452638 RepID=B1XUF1_POLNS
MNLSKDSCLIFIPYGVVAQLDATNLQGAYSDPNYVDSNGVTTPYYNDEYIADVAVNWLSAKAVNDRPWCLTVGLQNPHDYQFFSDRD